MGYQAYSLFCAVAMLGSGQSPLQSSYVCQPSFEHDERLRYPVQPYMPQPGDFMLLTSGQWWNEPVHRLAGGGIIHHSGIVFMRPDGTLALLEAFPFDKGVVRTLGAMDQLRKYSEDSRVWVRQRRVPLTEEQSQRLTEYAMAQNGVPFAWFRIFLQGTPLRSRGHFRTEFLGKPVGNRQGFFCSELVTEACVAAGLLDRQTARPSATYPADLFLERSSNPWLAKHLNLNEDWLPPARWVQTAVGEVANGRNAPSRTEVRRVSVGK
jgi:hypothetical protein